MPALRTLVFEVIACDWWIILTESRTPRFAPLDTTQEEDDDEPVRSTETICINASTTTLKKLRKVWAIIEKVPALSPGPERAALINAKLNDINDLLAHCELEKEDSEQSGDGAEDEDNEAEAEAEADADADADTPTSQSGDHDNDDALDEVNSGSEAGGGGEDNAISDAEGEGNAAGDEEESADDAFLKQWLTSLDVRRMLHTLSTVRLDLYH